MITQPWNIVPYETFTKSTCYKLEFHFRKIPGGGNCICRSLVVMITWSARFNLCAKLYPIKGMLGMLHSQLHLRALALWPIFGMTICKACRENNSLQQLSRSDQSQSRASGHGLGNLNQQVLLIKPQKCKRKIIKCAIPAPNIQSLL